MTSQNRRDGTPFAKPSQTTTSVSLAPILFLLLASVMLAAVPPSAGAQVPPGGPRAQGPAPPPRGLTITGEVKNYVPVTEEMLRNPPPGDWLMARRNYQAWSHSPLTEITRQNVKDLRLAWSWSMTEGAANQPMPLVHNGVMYLVNALGVVQALVRGEIVKEGGSEVERGDALCSDQAQRLAWVPTRLGHVAASDEVHREQRVDSHRVVQRHHTERPVTRQVAVLERLADPTGTVGCVGAGHALGTTGRSRRVEEE